MFQFDELRGKVTHIFLYLWAIVKPLEVLIAVTYQVIHLLV